MNQTSVRIGRNAPPKNLNRVIFFSMNSRLSLAGSTLAGLTLLSCFPYLTAVADVQLQKTVRLFSSVGAQERAATSAEVIAFQKISSIIVDNKSRYFLFAWEAPFTWLPSANASGKLRGRTLLYKVVTPEFWSWGRPPRSEYLFPPLPGCTYVMGDISPSGRLVAFYELNVDSGKARCGVVEILAEAPAKITWFNAVPDVRELSRTPLWISDDELIYPTIGKNEESVRVHLSTRAEISTQTMITAREVSSLEHGSRSIEAQDGMLKVLITDNADHIAVKCIRNKQEAVIFDNSRRPVASADADTLIGTRDDSKKLKRPWQPEDSVAVRYFGWRADALTDWLNDRKQSKAADAETSSRWGKEEGLFYSADRKRFFCVAVHGDLQTDSKEFTVYIFDVDEIRNRLRTDNERQLKDDAFIGKIVFRSNSLRGADAITDLQWGVGSDVILFRGMTSPDHYEAFQYQVSSKHLKQLTRTDGEGVISFVYRAGTLFFWVGRDRPTFEFRYPVEPVLRYPMGFFSNVDASKTDLAAAEYEMSTVGIYDYGRQARGPARYFCQIGTPGEQYEIEEAFGANFAISPDGRFATIPRLLRNRAWIDIVKVESRCNVTVASAECGTPAGVNQKVIWSPDSRRVFFVDAGPAAVNAGRSDRSQKAPTVSIYDIEANSWKFLDDDSVTGTGRLEWDDASAQLKLIWKDEQGREIVRAYQLNETLGLKFVGTGRDLIVDCTEKDSMAILIRKGENHPPELIATNGAKEISLLWPDPVLAPVERVRLQQFQWRDFGGTFHKGSLALPSDYQQGTRVPVVIQPYYEPMPELFLPDGANSNDATQALAAKGIAVLNVADTFKYSYKFRSENLDAEWAISVANLDAIVDTLVEQGIADPSRIGLSGFSEGGRQVYQSISHPGRTRVGAAVVADSSLNSFAEYLFNMAGQGTRLWYRNGRSFWSDPELWLAGDPFFNSDRIETPVLLSASYRSDERNDNELSRFEIGALRLNKKPFEFLNFPNSTHVLRRPLQRVAMMRSIVDWMVFWLKNEENPDPAQAYLMQRWRSVRMAWIRDRVASYGDEREGFINTRSGLSYRINERKSGLSGRSGDIYTVHYVATADDGNEIENTYKRNAPKRIIMSECNLGKGNFKADREGMKGLDEGLRLMHVGERATFVYGPEARSLDDDIRKLMPAGASVRYEVEVLAISTAETVTAAN